MVIFPFFLVRSASGFHSNIITIATVHLNLFSKFDWSILIGNILIGESCHVVQILISLPIKPVVVGLEVFPP